MSDQEILHFDVVIVGGGPAGLAAALTLAGGVGRGGLSVALVEKAGRMGGHSLSGALVEEEALAAILPAASPDLLGVPVTAEYFYFLNENRSFPLPVSSSFSNKGCRIVRLGRLCRFLAREVEQAGVELFPGFAARDLIMGEGQVLGVTATGVDLMARAVILAEGARGHLSRRVITHFSLDRGRCPQTYGLGIKELWEVPEGMAGEVLHTVGWPLAGMAHGGGFLYGPAPQQVAVGLVTALDYADPYLDPFQQFQRFKSHPAIGQRLAGGRRLSYGARVLVEGGWQSLPAVAFPGGVLVGDAAGLLNPARLKGIRAALYSGKLAAETVLVALARGGPARVRDLAAYARRLSASFIGRDLWRGRNVRPGFRLGLVPGLGNAAWESLTAGAAPWILGGWSEDRHALQAAARFRPHPSQPADGIRTFDRPSSLHLAALSPPMGESHLLTGDPALFTGILRQRFANPETRYCPAGVYQADNGQGYRIQAADCLHCKCCDIKDPLDNIRWTPPEDGSGPDYRDL